MYNPPINPKQPGAPFLTINHFGFWGWHSDNAMNTPEDVFKQIMYRCSLVNYLDLLKMLGTSSQNIFPNGGFYGDESHGRILGFMVMNPMVESVKNHEKKTQIQD